MKQRNIRGMWLTGLIKAVKKCVHIHYAVVDNKDYVCSLCHDRIVAKAVAEEMNATSRVNGYKVKRLVSFSWF